MGVIGDAGRDELSAIGEVSVIDEDGGRRTVKLRSLHAQQTPRPAVSPLLGLPYTSDPSGTGYQVDTSREG